MHSSFRQGFEKSAAPFAKFKPTVPKPIKGVGQWVNPAPVRGAKAAPTQPVVSSNA